MKSLTPFRDINVHSSATQYSFTSPSAPSAPTLVIQRPSGDIRLNEGALLGSKRVSSIAGILGVIKLRLDKYVIVITKAQLMGRLNGHMVYRVVAAEFLPLRERALHDPDEDTYLHLLRTCIKSSPLYFSYSLDITNSFQRQSQAPTQSPLWRRADDRFFWNRFIQSDLIDFANATDNATGMRASTLSGGADPFILPVMYGMLRISPARIKNVPFTFVLITRRSRHRAGTRYFTRGMNDQGHVANFNETEQIVVLNERSSLGTRPQGEEAQVLSYVQTRGSVPVFWSEMNTLQYSPQLQVRNVDTALRAARKHFDEQISLYGDNYLVNLVNQKGREDKVKQAYEHLVRKLISQPHEAADSDRVSDEKVRVLESAHPAQKYDRLHYVYFDFHNETKGLRWYRAKILLDQLEAALIEGLYFRGLEMPADAQGRLDVRTQQMAVVRTNCMDCLDRTNVIQTMLARWTLTRQFIDAGILRPGESSQDDPVFEAFFRNVWADNADVVSRTYSGTGALKTDFTRTGNRTRAGAAQDLKNSLTRYIKNNFLDGPRQDAFDLLLGTFHPQPIGTAFADRRPVMIQAIPYIFFSCLFFVLVAGMTRTRAETTVWPLRLLAFVCLLVAIYCGRFMLLNGILYVQWPKLNTPEYATDGMRETMARALKDPILGRFIGGPERAYGIAWQRSMEDGKVRVQ